MPVYAYKAWNKSGKAVRGVMEAVSEEELAGHLRKMGYMPTTIDESSPVVLVKESRPIFFKVRPVDMIVFNMQLSNMIGAGLTLLNSLQVIVKQIVNKGFRDIVEVVSQSVAAGSSFSEALNKHPKIFSKLFVHMVTAGETAGTLHTVLDRYSIYVEQQEELNQQIRNAIFYPLILLCFGLCVIVYIVSFIIPKFIEVFEKSNVELPLPTLIINSVGEVLRNQWWLIILIGIGVVFLAQAYLRTKTGKFQYDQFVLGLPVVGSLWRKIILSRFSRTLATLLNSGVSLLVALDIVGNVSGNEIFRNEIKKIRDGVEKGEALHKPLEKSKEFPSDIIQMIAVGEETGKLGHMLNKVADFYDANVNHSLKRLITLIEPILIVVMAGMVGLIMASVILPLFDMVKTVR